MEVPDGIKEEGKSGWYWKLEKALYGLKQAGCQWKMRLDEAMTELNLQKSKVDDCLYVLREIDSITLFMLIYVDDMAIAGQTLQRVETFKADFRKNFEITDIGKLKYILGIQVT